MDGAIAADLGDLTYAGVIHSKDSLYAREFQAGPKAADHDKVKKEATNANDGELTSVAAWLAVHELAACQWRHCK